MPVANLFSHNVGTGLTRHQAILADVLTDAGFEVRSHAIPPRGRGDMLYVHARRLPFLPGRADVNVFVQDLVPSWFARARVNVLMPMQEWFDERELRLLRAIDVLMCNSEHGREAFLPYFPSAINTGFTSDDRREPTSSRHRILHIAGRSPFKGAQTIVDLWARHPEWPTLTLCHGDDVMGRCTVPNIEQHIGHLPDAQLKRLQNEAWLHLQPSEAEGFGHCLCEALSVGALVLTTDAPPMNELIGADRGVLVPSDVAPIPLHLGFRFPVSAVALEATLTELLREGPEPHRAKMEAARAWFEANDRRVRDRLREHFHRLRA